MSAVFAERAASGTLFQAVDIGHPVYAAVTDPQTAFWALVDKTRVHEANRDPALLAAYGAKAGQFEQELHALRFGLKPSGVYLNPTERCNLNCTYCYLPDTQRSGGSHMPVETLLASLGKLRDYAICPTPSAAVAVTCRLKRCSPRWPSCAIIFVR